MSSSNISVKSVQLLVYSFATIGFIIYLVSLLDIDWLGNLGELKFILSWLGIFVFSFVIFTWYRLTNMIFTPYIIFIGFFILFNYGQPLMWAIGIHSPDEIGRVPIYPGYGIPSDLDIIKGQLLVLTSILMFHLGAMFSYKKRSKKKVKLNPEKQKAATDNLSLKVIFYISLITNIVATPLALYNLFLDYQVASSLGYSALYYSEYATGGITLFGLGNLFFFPSLIGILIGSKFSIKIRYYVYFVMFFFIMLNLLIGERGTWIFKVLILIWLFHTSYKKISSKKLLLIIPILVISLYLLNAIVSLRNDAITVENIVNSLSIKNSPIVDTFFEMGGSMKPMMFLQMHGWDIWPHSNTYVLATGALLSNSLLDLLGIHWEVINNFFKDYLDIPWGPAFSIIAEPLMNFGPLFAPLFMIVLGYIISTIIYVDKTFHYTFNPLRFLFVASSVNVLLRLTRNSIHVPLKRWFYGVVIFCIIIFIIKKLIINKNNIQKPKLT